MGEGLFLWFYADLLGGWGVAERPTGDAQHAPQQSFKM